MPNIHHRSGLVLAAAFCLLAAQAAAEPLYQDDRSTPQALMASFFNAVLRNELARAAAYHDDAAAGALLAESLAGTETLDFAYGALEEETDEGAVRYALPVSVTIPEAEGLKTMSGCAELRLPDTMANPPKPLSLVSLTLAAASQDEKAPKACALMPPADPDGRIEARAAFLTGHRGKCESTEPGADPEMALPQMHDLKFRFDSDAADAPQRTYKLYEFFCRAGAYNGVAVYYLENDEGLIAPVSFAVPELAIAYKDSENKVVESLAVSGYRTSDEVFNAGFDADSMTISSFDKWRGPGDASSAGTWAFRNGAFTLVSYDVDASFDGEENPQSVVDHASAP